MSILSPKGFEGIHLTNIILEEKRTCCLLKKKKKKSPVASHRAHKRLELLATNHKVLPDLESLLSISATFICFDIHGSPHQTFPALRFPHEPAKTWSLHRDFFSPRISSNSPPPTRTQGQVPSNMKALHQPHPPGKETKSKNYDPIAWGKETPNSQLDKMKRQRNTMQMKNKNSQDKIYKEKISILQGRKCKNHIIHLKRT